MARLPSLRFRGDRWAYSVFAALVGVWLAAAWVNAWYVADRFAHHSVIVDATIVRTIQWGCFGARGSGTGMDNRDNMLAIRAAQKAVAEADPLVDYVPTSHDAVEIGSEAGLHYK